MPVKSSAKGVGFFFLFGDYKNKPSTSTFCFSSYLCNVLCTKTADRWAKRMPRLGKDHCLCRLLRWHENSMTLFSRIEQVGDVSPHFQTSFSWHKSSFMCRKKKPYASSQSLHEVCTSGFSFLKAEKMKNRHLTQCGVQFCCQEGVAGGGISCCSTIKHAPQPFHLGRVLIFCSLLVSLNSYQAGQIRNQIYLESITYR